MGSIAVIGADIGKNSFHIVGHDKRGAIVLRQKWSRGQIEAQLAKHAALPNRHGSLRRRASAPSGNALSLPTSPTEYRPGVSVLMPKARVYDAAKEFGSPVGGPYHA